MDAEVLELVTLLSSNDEEVSDCLSVPDSVSSGVYFCLFIFFYTRITEMVFMYLFLSLSKAKCCLFDPTNSNALHSSVRHATCPSALFWPGALTSFIITFLHF